MKFQLREYQKEAAQQVVAHLVKGRKKVLLAAPTGSGKTVIASYGIFPTLPKKWKIQVVTPRVEIVRQWIATNYYAGFSHIHVTTPLLAGRGRYDLIVLDEAHHAPASTWRIAASSAPRLLGMTGTPWRTDGQGLRQFFDVMVKTPWIEELTKEGFLAPVDLWTHPDAADAVSHAKVRCGDYDMSSIPVGSRSLLGSLPVHYKKRLNGKRALCFACTVEHGEMIRKRFENQGVKCAAVYSRTPRKQRVEIFDAFGRGDIPVLVNVMVASEGYDMPDMEGIIMARPTMSRTLWRQMIGRGMRPQPGKRLVVLDHCGNTLSFGHPALDDDFDLSVGKIAAPMAEKPMGLEMLRTWEAPEEKRGELVHVGADDFMPPPVYDHELETKTSFARA